MITGLHIENYALISEMDIEPDRHLNIITGETGAGKSIIMGALSLLLGGRADFKTIRNPQKKTIVEATFNIEGLPNISKILNDNEIDDFKGILILRRELSAKGLSRAFVNDSPVNLQILRIISEELIDIHSQHQNLLLCDNAYQLQVIDALADNAALLSEYTKHYKSYRQALSEYTSTRDMLARNKAEAEYIAYQLEQLDELNVKEGEQEELERQRQTAANFTAIKTSVNNAIDAIGGSPNIVSAINQAIDELSDIDSFYDKADETADRLNSCKLEIQDILDTLEAYNASLSSDGLDLEEIESRLSQIYSLEARHHVDTDSQLIELQKKLRNQLNTINDADNVLAELEAKAKMAKREAVLAAKTISQRRHETAEKLSVKLTEKARPLGLPNFKCEIRLTQSKLSATGIDDVDYLFAFNKNQSPVPVAQTASGGEISRIVLALKSIAVEHMKLPTIIFDEIDTGVSGEAANRIASLMHALARREQVITITHLPQVAAAADKHYKVFKSDSETETTTHIAALDNQGRVTELALMLGGEQAGQAASQTAKALIDNYKTT